MHQDDVAAGEFVAARHLLLDELAVVADEFEVEILHPAAGVARAGGRLADVAKTLPEGEKVDVSALDGARHNPRARISTYIGGKKFTIDPPARRHFENWGKGRH